MSTIYLIRHGKTPANEQHLYCGSTDLPLSTQGREELSGLSYRIDNAIFITSGMKRTNETLQLLFGGVPFTIREEFREVDFGDFEMRSYEQLKNQPAYQLWLSGNNEANIPPNGESGVQMQERVLRCFLEIAQSPEDTVIITHGGVIAAIMADLFPHENRNRYQWQPTPGHGYAIISGTYRKIP